MQINTNASLEDTRQHRWWKMLEIVQGFAGANPVNNAVGTEPVRRLIYKFCLSIGATVDLDMPETRLLRKLLDRVNQFSAGRTIGAPAPPFYSSGTTARPQDPLAILERKMVSELRRCSGFSTIGPIVINGTAPDPNDTRTLLTRKILKRLNQIIG